ncbi:MAG TPA: carbohydrate kinase [Streptosporangiaceae bacterium]
MITVAGEVVIDLVDEGGGLYRAYPGGSAANAAVGLARLGVPCSILARLSTDALGGQLASHLAGNGVSLRDAVRAAEPTTLALASLDEAGRAAYSFYFQGTADWQWRRDELPGALAPDVTALHAGSMTLALAPGARAVEDLLAAERARGRVTISIDPNIRPHIAAGRADEVARVERQIRLAHIVKASEEDTDWLYPGLGYESVARAWQQLGPDLVVITLGARGAYALAPDGTQVRRPARPVVVADTVGAGDAFCAGLLDALWRRGLLGCANGPSAPDDAAENAGGAGGVMPLGRIAAGDITEVVDWAVLAATVTCERPGADPPTRQEMLQAR